MGQRIHPSGSCQVPNSTRQAEPALHLSAPRSPLTPRRQGSQNAARIGGTGFPTGAATFNSGTGFQPVIFVPPSLFHTVHHASRAVPHLCPCVPLSYDRSLALDSRCQGLAGRGSFPSAPQPCFRRPFPPSSLRRFDPSSLCPCVPPSLCYDTAVTHDGPVRRSVAMRPLGSVFRWTARCASRRYG
jgi:hypothetical protein